MSFLNLNGHNELGQFKVNIYVNNDQFAKRMFVNYKSLGIDKTTKSHVFAFAKKNFDDYDETTQTQHVEKVIFLMKKINHNMNNYLSSDEFLNCVIELTEIVKKVNISSLLDIDEDLLDAFLENILSISGENNMPNISRNHRLLFALIDLILSFTDQDEEIVNSMCDKGFVRFAKFFRDNPLVFRRDKEIYLSLSKAACKSKRVRDKIMNVFVTNYFKLMIQNVADELFVSVFILLASYTTAPLSKTEYDHIAQCFKIGLQCGYPDALPYIAIGTHNLIKKKRILLDYEIEHLKIIFLLMTRRSDNDVLIEYTIYMATKLLLLHVNIFVDFAYIMNSLSHQNPQIQIAAAFFLSTVSNCEPRLLQNMNANIIECIREVHTHYMSAAYSVKSYFDETIVFLLHNPNYDKDEVFTLLDDGFIDTFVQILQTKKSDLFDLAIIYTNQLFNRSVEVNLYEKLSNLFTESYGFEYLHELMNNPDFVSLNEQRAILVESIITRFEHTE
ncbi:hypothetical protein TRFO_38232 [Tritrichomonas foetus]|uniref:Uncharacterized protein n=1 Tax=Tritrichomonas foetus TaxID=1144522 RepID=A0A1J4JDX2_9EUKA|nr:hypothetical protein TRFO_38232 [Tritrichomonas foetus]|eukprot:OHS95637.1 hypothetical protein TRFO_38232 [Tritrichomonas foetus]